MIDPDHRLNRSGFREWAAPFLRESGLSADFEISPMPGGANNRVYRVDAAGGAYVLKAYFAHPADLRDRFGAERAFYQVLKGGGVGACPEALGWDSARRLGLLRFIPGRKVAAGEVTEEFVARAFDFIEEVNRARSHSAAQQVPTASEACFSVAEHLDCVERRVARLRDLEIRAEIDQEAARFVQEQLAPCWQSVRAWVMGQPGTSPPSADDILQLADRCLSPSDFGFHNAILTPAGELRFFDFEYAGWDDPAKLICDFFCQPQVPVPLEHWASVSSRMENWAGPKGAVPNRARLLLPAYQIKWCCIMLNDFLAIDQLRREFAHDSTASRKPQQLEKARRALAKVTLG